MDKANHACMYGSCQSSKEITYNFKRKSNYVAYKKNIEFGKRINLRQVSQNSLSYTLVRWYFFFLSIVKEKSKSISQFLIKCLWCWDFHICIVSSDKSPVLISDQKE